MANVTKSEKAIKRDIAAFVHDAFEEIGNEQGLTGLQSFVRWASQPQNQTAFYTQIWGKLIPKPVEVSGPQGGPMKLVVAWENDPAAIPMAALTALDAEAIEDADVQSDVD